MQKEKFELARAKISTSASKRELVFVFGAGASIALNPTPEVPNWNGLIKSGLKYLRERGLITSAQEISYSEIAVSDDIDDAITVAEFVSRKLDKTDVNQRRAWLTETFEDVRPKINSMYRAINRINDAGIPIATTNYDTLLEEVTGLPSSIISNPPQGISWVKNEQPSVLHLHGVWSQPESCILGARDYEKVVAEEGRRFLQSAITMLKRIVFVGCGETFADPNFQSLISWVRRESVGVAPTHYSIVLDQQYEGRRADKSWMGFVEPLPVGPSYSDVPKFLNEIKLAQGPIAVNSLSEQHDAVLRAYKEFLVSDCGQMTVEGVRADLDTSQRKFDLEKLFVPLTVSPVPPEFSKDEKERDEKLEEWIEENPLNQAFGKVFENNKRIVILALPGGGKTLLTKRLTVAYADSDRIKDSHDNLPEMNLTPVLIRCREWKDQIRRPIKDIIKSIPAFYGEEQIGDLFLALKPKFESGDVVLIIDGLDEIHDDAAREIFTENLEKFLEKFPEIRLLVTSREAGFDLVAPCLVRFCSRWRVDPLGQNAIRLLSNHWHRLMLGSTPEASAEADEVTEAVLSQSALKRLAENPLLLTMLLVVKHGNGRLPPDKVTLYNRAVEVLLDTWNIKGHAPLNAREAVPQLAFLAFSLHADGKQTATQEEAVAAIELGRDRHPTLKRYARDEPSQFIHRVELRSSLLIEGGHRLENSIAKPFYQFRHLTFQEYLTAVAAVEGYVIHGSRRQTLMEILKPHLLAAEWKEVIPMAVALGRRQAEGVIRELARLSKEEFEHQTKSDENIYASGDQMPPATSILTECFVAEAEFPSDLVDEILSRISYFACGSNTGHDWVSLVRGPYGSELIQQATDLATRLSDPNYGWLRNTLATFEAFRRFDAQRNILDWKIELLEDLSHPSENVKLQAVLSVAGAIWHDRNCGSLDSDWEIHHKIGELILEPAGPVGSAATWAWAFQLNRVVELQINPEVLHTNIFRCLADRILEADIYRDRMSSFALAAFSYFESDQKSFPLSIEKAEAFKTLFREVEKTETDKFDVERDKPYVQLSCLVALHLANDGSYTDFIVQNLKLMDDLVILREAAYNLGHHYGLDPDDID